MDEQQAPGPLPPATASAVPPHHEHKAAPPNAQAAGATAAAQPGPKKATPQRLLEQAGNQMSALQQADTIKQLQKQVTQLESQTKDTGRVFVATTAALISSAFALVAALAWNEAIQALFKQVFPANTAGQSGWGLVVSTFGYALVITIIVVVVIFQLSRLTSKVGGKSLIGGGGGGHEG